jgi:hypothetical protein
LLLRGEKFSADVSAETVPPPVGGALFIVSQYQAVSQLQQH